MERILQFIIGGLTLTVIILLLIIVFNMYHTGVKDDFQVMKTQIENMNNYCFINE